MLVHGLGSVSFERLERWQDVADSIVKFDGAAVSGTVLSGTRIDATIPTVSADGAHSVIVENPSPGGGASNALTLTSTTVSTPVITGLAPSPAPADQSFTLTVSGAAFTCSGAGAVVLFDGGTITPGSCSPTQLVAALPATPAGSVPVQVKNPNGDLSNVVSLSVVAPNPVPVLSAIAPSSVNAGTAGVMLTVSGSAFVAASQATLDGANRPTTVVEHQTALSGPTKEFHREHHRVHLPHPRP